MKEIQIEQPHGYLLDPDGKVCLKFANWSTGIHTVPDYVDSRRSVEYVEGPASHDVELHEEYTGDYDD